MPAVFWVGFVFFSHLHKQFIGGYIDDGCNRDLEGLPCTGIGFEAIGILFGRFEYSLNTGPGPLDVSGNAAPLLWSIASDQALSNLIEGCSPLDIFLHHDKCERLAIPFLLPDGNNLFPAQAGWNLPLVILKRCGCKLLLCETFGYS